MSRHFMILLDSFHESCLWKLEPGFWTYGWIQLGTSGPNKASRPQPPRPRHFFQISWFYWIHLMILEKMRPCLWKLEPGFWTYGWICLLGPSDPNVVSRHQVAMSRHFFRFHDFIGFISWFLRKWRPVCENWSQGSELMAGYVFWAQVAQIKFLGPRSQVKTFFQISWF